MSQRLFISYRRSKASLVDALVAALEAEGVEVWIDRSEIEDAASIQRRIDEGLASCHALLAWYSADYPKSRACQWELTAALIAAGAETAPVKRILVINPEADNAHIQPLRVRDLQHFGLDGDVAAAARRIAMAMRPIQGEFGALRRLSRPQAYGFTPLGSSRFVGRVTRLWDIHSALTAGNFAIVAGQPSPAAKGDLAQVRGSGGIGKSLLAEEYALRFGAFWPGGLFWLRAYGVSDNSDESPAALAERRELAYGSQLVGFCHALGIDTREKTNQQLRAELGRAMTTRYLWIVDDLPSGDRKDLEAWLAPSSAGHTLMTTRSRRLDGLGSAIDLGMLEADDARALLTLGHPLSTGEQDAVARILELLDDHALAVDVARAACRRLGYAGFCQRLETPGADAMALAGELAQDTPSGHNPYIAVTLLGSIRQLGSHGMDCLRIAASLAVAPIPSELVAACLAEADGLPELTAEDRAALGVQQLLDHSLAEEAGDAGEFSIHTLIARTLRFCDENGAERREQLRAALLRQLLGQMPLAVDIRNHARLQSILAHAQWLARQANDVAGLDLAAWLGRLELEAGRFRDSERWYRLEHDGRLQLLGQEHPSTLASMNNLALTLTRQGDYGSARTLHEEELGVCRRVLGEEHPDTLASMNNLARILVEQGDLVGGRALQEQTLARCRHVLGEEHPGTLTSMSNLAHALSRQGEYAGARKLQEQVRAIHSRKLGEEHPDTLRSINNLALTLADQGDHARARELHQQVLAICRRVLGEEHPDTLSSLNNVALAMAAHGDFVGARTLQEQALAISRRVQGEAFPETLISMNNLASTLWSQGDYAGARMLQEQTLAIRRHALGEEHPDTLTSMNNLATTLARQGDHAGARTLQEQTLAISRSRLGEAHPRTLTSMNNLAMTLARQGDHAGARTLQEQTLPLCRSALGHKHPETVSSACNLFWSLVALGDKSAARALFEIDLKWLLSEDEAALSADLRHIRSMLQQKLDS
jgi:hypothetical protein